MRCSTSRKTTFAEAMASARPATRPTTSIASGIASQISVRTRGSAIRLTTITTTSMATKATSWVATVEKATSWRGKRTFRISSE